MNQWYKTYLTYKATTVCINFLKEREEVVFPCILKMGSILKIGWLRIFWQWNESLFIETEGGSLIYHQVFVYRMPNTSLDMFINRIGNIINIITRQNKLWYFLADLNIDLLKPENHSPTSEFLDIMYSYSMFPLITKPTRVTKNTATLIDHYIH